MLLLPGVRQPCTSDRNIDMTVGGKSGGRADNSALNEAT